LTDLLEFNVNALGPGETLKLPASGGSVAFKGQVWSFVPLTRVVIYRNGQVWREVPLNKDRRGARIQETVRIDESAWFSLTAEGRGTIHGCPLLKPRPAPVRLFVTKIVVVIRRVFIQWIDK
jgi:hypothetical protein